MPLEKTGADSLWYYLTGAGSDGGAQADPDASLGDYRSSTAVESLTPTSSAIVLGSGSLTLVRVGDGQEGTGTVTAIDADSITWTPPGGSAGATVQIMNGETRQIRGSDQDRFIIVTRDNANSFTGTDTITYAYASPCVFGFRTLTPAERVAGITLYRGIMLKNESATGITTVKFALDVLGTQRVSDSGQLGASGAGTITSSTGGAFDDWPAQGFCAIKIAAGTLREVIYYSSRTATELWVPAIGRGALSTTPAAGLATDTVDAIPGLRMAKEAPASQPSGNIQTIADEETSPTGRTWKIPITDAEAEAMIDLSAGYIYGLWLEMDVPAGVEAEQLATRAIRVINDAA